MNKKLMALAVAGALGAPAAAMAQNYSIYGRLTLGVDSFEAKGTNATYNSGGTSNLTGSANDYKQRARVFDNGSRVGFRGTEDLGGGVQANFLIETGVNVDNGSTTGQGGQTNTSTANWGSRVGHVGLAGSIGQITYGRSNVWWVNGAIEQVGANWLNAGAQLYSGSFGRGMSVGVSRVSNVMQYTSPTWSGFNFQVSASPGRGEAQGPSTNTDGLLTAFTFQGTHGPFAWGVDLVRDEGNTPPTTGAVAPQQGATVGNKFRFGYRYLPAGQISAIMVAVKAENGGPGNATTSNTGFVAACNGTSAAATCDQTQSGLGFSWDHMFGPFHPIVQYYKINNIKVSGGNGVGTSGQCLTPGGGTDCAGTGAKQITVGLRYIFSKRTHAYVSYNKIDNDDNYNQDFNGASLTSRDPTTSAAFPTGRQSVGADPTIIAVGMIHNF